MVLIKVKPKDIEKVFEILSENGRFIFVESDKFRIIEHSEMILKKIEEEGIKVDILEDKEDGDNKKGE